MWFVELAKLIIDWLKEYIDLFIILVIVGGIVIFIYIESDDYRERFQIPRFHLGHLDEMDVITSDIELATMSITVVPMIKIEYEGEIICSVEMENYYSQNYSLLVSNFTEDSRCTVKVDNEQRKKGEQLTKKINELLMEKWEESISFNIYRAYLMQVTWQNRKANTEETGHWYFNGERERHITEEEAIFQGPDEKIDLDKFDEEGFIYNNEQLMKVIDLCTDIVSNRRGE